MSEKQLVSVNLYGGVLCKPKKPYSLVKVYCNNCENCPLYKKHKCISTNRTTTLNVCPYAEIETQVGKSSRSKNYCDLKIDYKANYESFDNFKAVTPKIIAIGDYYYIDFTWQIIDLRRDLRGQPIPNDFILSNSGWFNTSGKWFRKDLVPIDLLKQLFTQTKVSHNFFEGWKDVTDRYIKEDVEPGKASLRQYNPELLRELGLEKDAINYVGQKARLVTLTAPFIFKRDDSDNRKFRYNEDKTISPIDINSSIDNWLVGESFTRLGTVIEERSQIFFKPSENLVIEILDNSWVNESTEII